MRRKTGREQGCPSRLIPMRQLDEVVWADLGDLLTHPETMRQALGRAQSGEWLPQELQARRNGLRKASTSLSRQGDRLTEAYLEQIVSLEEYRRRRQDFEERQESMKAQIRELEASLNHQKELAVVAEGIESFCQRVQQGLEQAPFEQKRHLVELLIDRVVVTGDEVEIRYVIPTSPRGEASRFYQLRIPYCGAVPSLLQGRMPQRPLASEPGRGQTTSRRSSSAIPTNSARTRGERAATNRLARRSPPSQSFLPCRTRCRLTAGFGAITTARLRA